MQSYDTKRVRDGLFLVRDALRSPVADYFSIGASSQTSQEDQRGPVETGGSRTGSDVPTSKSKNETVED